MNLEVTTIVQHTKLTFFGFINSFGVSLFLGISLVVVLESVELITTRRENSLVSYVAEGRFYLMLRD